MKPALMSLLVGDRDYLHPVDPQAYVFVIFVFCVMMEAEPVSEMLCVFKEK
jgi:hypothetical protein